jgi:hypothetical protein
MMIFGVLLWYIETAMHTPSSVATIRWPRTLLYAPYLEVRNEQRRRGQLKARVRGACCIEVDILMSWILKPQTFHPSISIFRRSWIWVWNMRGKRRKAPKSLVNHHFPNIKLATSSCRCLPESCQGWGCEPWSLATFTMEITIWDI